MKRTEFVALVAFLVISLALAVTVFSYGGVDFNVYYAAARVYLSGGNPYDFQQLSAEIISATGSMNNPYYYAPWFIWALIPFSLLPFQVARLLWAVANFLLWVSGLLILWKILPWPPNGWLRWAMYLLVTIMFAWSTWGSDQVGILIFFMFVMAIRAAYRGQWVQSGIWLALLLFKPNITIIPIAAIAIWLLKRGNWRPVVFAAAFAALMLAVSLIMSPGWYQALLASDKLTGLSQTLDISGAGSIQRIHTTLTHWLLAYGMTKHLAGAIHAGIFVIGVGIVIWVALCSNSMVEVAAVSLLAQFVIAPYTLFYDYPSLVLTLFYANSIPLHPQWAQRGRIALNLLAPLSLMIGDNIAFRYWVVIIFALLLALSWATRLPDTAGGLIPAGD